MTCSTMLSKNRDMIVNIHVPNFWKSAKNKWHKSVDRNQDGDCLLGESRSADWQVSWGNILPKQMNCILFSIMVKWL